MLCPQCGVDVGNAISLCDNCTKARERVAEPAQQTDYRKQAPVDGEKLKELYNQSLGVTQSEKVLQLLSRPLPLTLLSVLGYLLLCLTLLLSFPGLKWYVVGLLGISMFTALAYYAVYLTVLMDLFYVERTAFVICVLGMLSVPFVAFMYKDEIGTRKLLIASSLFLIAIFTGVSATVIGAQDFANSRISSFIGGGMPGRFGSSGGHGFVDGSAFEQEKSYRDVTGHGALE